ncbi:glycosyltransferase [Yimella sp. cx-573]|nr:glycosyltransferase [Yimella sp. cx-573]
MMSLDRIGHNPTQTGVTVVVVAFNHESFGEGALDSIRAQTLAPDHVIIVDDASHDETPRRIRDWLSANSVGWEFWGFSENAGLCRRLNEALAVIQTPTYAYISADDLMAPTRLAKQVARIQEDDRIAAVYSNARRISSDGSLLEPDYKTLHQWPESLEGDIHLALLAHCWIPAASVLLRTSTVRDVGGYDERWFFEDYDLWLRLAARYRFLVVDEPLVDFRELASSLGSTRFTDDDAGYLAARVGIYLKQIGVSSDGDQFIDRILPPIAMRLWRSGEHHELVAEAFARCHGDHWRKLRLRGFLLRLGLVREPRIIRGASAVVGTLRRFARRSRCGSRQFR